MIVLRDQTRMRLMIASLPLVLMLGSCVEVTSPVVIGSRIPALEPTQWDGRWRSPDGLQVDLQVTNPQKGMLSLSWTLDDSNQLKTDSIAYVRVIEDCTLVSVPLESGSSPATFAWARVYKHDNQMFIVRPSVPLFRKFVEDGRLAGSIVAERVALRDVASSDIEELMRFWKPYMFDVEHPIQLRRAKD